MTSILHAKRIVLSVTGGIAAYKAADLASKLVQQGAVVDAVLTTAAQHFVTAATFEAITNRPVHTTVLEPWGSGWHGHISLGHEADLVAVVPATADAISRLAHGSASDMMGALILSTTAPVLVAPAMEHNMYHHPATQRNLQTLQTLGYHQIGPESGWLASGESGDGRLAASGQLIGRMRLILGAQGPLAGKKIVVTAGGTQEQWDPVRYLGNRSSGRMGFAVAQAAIDAGAEVTLIAGPVHLLPPVGAHYVPVVSAVEMAAVVEKATQNADVLIMAAAVADFRPVEQSNEKMKKQTGRQSMTLETTRNPDIVQGITRPGLLKIGFAAETADLVANATVKLHNKNLGLIVANDAVATIGSLQSQATLIWPTGRTESLPLLAKEALAAILVEKVDALLQGKAE